MFKHFVMIFIMLLCVGKLRQHKTELKTVYVEPDYIECKACLRSTTN